jgi:hypothetical protein
VLGVPGEMRKWQTVFSKSKIVEACGRDVRAAESVLSLRVRVGNISISGVRGETPRHKRHKSARKRETRDKTKTACFKRIILG